MFMSGETELNPRQLDARQAALRSPSPSWCHPLSSTIGHRCYGVNPRTHTLRYLAAGEGTA